MLDFTEEVIDATSAPVGSGYDGPSVRPHRWTLDSYLRAIAAGVFPAGDARRIDQRRTRRTYAYRNPARLCHSSTSRDAAKKRRTGGRNRQPGALRPRPTSRPEPDAFVAAAPIATTPSATRRPPTYSSSPGRRRLLRLRPHRPSSPSTPRPVSPSTGSSTLPAGVCSSSRSRTASKPTHGSAASERRGARARGTRHAPGRGAFRGRVAYPRQANDEMGWGPAWSLHVGQQALQCFWSRSFASTRPPPHHHKQHPRHGHQARRRHQRQPCVNRIAGSPR